MIFIKLIRGPMVVQWKSHYAIIRQTGVECWPNESYVESHNILRGCMGLLWESAGC